MPTRITDSIDAIVTALTAAGVKTWDGPVVTGDYSAAVFVGYDADPDGDFSAATANQEWAGIGAKKRNETISVTCAVVVLDGSSNVKAARDSVKSLFATVESTIRADPSLGFTPPYVAGVKPLQLFTELTTAGIQARLVFTVDISTRV